MFKHLSDILVSLVNGLWVLLGALAGFLLHVILQVLPTRRLWQLKAPKKLVIIVATSVKTHTGEYFRRATGIGQLRALSLVMASLNRGYGRIDAQNILMSDEELGEKAERDLVLLGGFKNNTFTRMILDRQSIVELGVDGIRWKLPGEEADFTPVIQDNRIMRDYGLIVRTENPFSGSSTTAVILAGVHTQGVIAAAKYFTEKMYRDLWCHGSPRHVVVVIGCDVINDYPVGIKIERKFKSKDGLCA